MNIDLLIPKKPKQKRSLDRYEKILRTSEKILIEEGVHGLTIQKVAKKAKMKRPSLYKLFPSAAAILFALSDKHAKKFASLFLNNTKNTEIQTLSWYFNLFIDLICIYLNQNKEASVLFFSLESFLTLETTNQQNKKLLSSVILQVLSSKKINVNADKVYIASQICLAVLLVGFREENYISPKYVVEAKKAVLAYLSST